MGERAGAEPRYTAFLSYSHKDAAAGRRLHRRLEAYRLPKRLVGAETPRGPVPERLAPIFRDREELPAATDLSETVRKALAGSGALIVLSSPHSAESLWVAEEIETFRRLHPDRPVLAAILDGDPPDCFPAALRAFGRDGTWHEPLATDLRRGRDGAHLGLLKLVAGITGVGLDALVQRDAARRVRRVMAVTGAALVAMLIMAALALVALDARREAERQRAEAEGLVEFMHGDLRSRLGEVGRLDVMRPVNERALTYYDRQLQRFDRPRDRLMRARVLQAIGEDSLAQRREATAIRLFRETYGATASLLAAGPNDSEKIFGHAQSEYWVGRVAYRHGEFAKARRRFERYKALAERLLALDPSNPAWMREAGYAEGVLCSVEQEMTAHPRDIPRSCTAALRWITRVRDLRPRDPRAILDLANRHAWMADAWDAIGRWDRVRIHRKEQEALVRPLLDRNPQDNDLRDFWMKTQFTFACLLVEHGEPAEARSRFDDAAAAGVRLHGLDGENSEWARWQQITAARENGCRRI